MVKQRRWEIVTCEQFEKRIMERTMTTVMTNDLHPLTSPLEGIGNGTDTRMQCSSSDLRNQQRDDSSWVWETAAQRQTGHRLSSSTLPRTEYSSRSSAIRHNSTRKLSLKMIEDYAPVFMLVNALLIQGTSNIALNVHTATSCTWTWNKFRSTNGFITWHGKA
jgi:hypothetical protein